MTIKPLGARILIKMVEEENLTTASGIVLPESAKEKPEIAEVVAVGEGDEDTKLDLNEMLGKKVIISKYSGTKVTVDDIEYTIVNAEDLLAVVED